MKIRYCTLFHFGVTLSKILLEAPICPLAEKPLFASNFPRINGIFWCPGKDPVVLPLALLNEHSLFFSSLIRCRSLRLLPNWTSKGIASPNGENGSSRMEWMACMTNQEEVENLFSPPEVAVHLVKIACERPDKVGRSISQWDCTELASQLVRDGIVESISPSTVRNILAHHKLKPWRNHMWLSPKHPRDAEFYDRVENIIDLYTRPLGSYERVFCIDEKTSLQPRPRLHETKPALPGKRPNLVEHEYRRQGALQLFSAFDTRSGKVYGKCYDRKRQVEFIDFLGGLESWLPKTITRIHVVLDNVPTHHGKMVREWLKKHSRFQFHFTPVHCSWMNQVEQWFGILQRKRLRIVDFASKDDLKVKITRFIKEWNEKALPFNWTTKSVAKVMADRPERLAA